MLYTGKRNATCELIRSRLSESFRLSEYSPTIEITTLPINEAGNESMNKYAKGASDNGLVVIGPSAFRYSEKVAGIQMRQEYYVILIYTNNKNNVKLNNDLMDIAESSLVEFMELQNSVTSDIMGYNSGTHLGVIVVKATPSF